MGVLGRVVTVVDFESLLFADVGSNLTWDFGFFHVWEAIQIDYRMLVVLLRSQVPTREIMHRWSSPVKAGKSPYDLNRVGVT